VQFPVVKVVSIAEKTNLSQESRESSVSKKAKHTIAEKTNLP